MGEEIRESTSAPLYRYEDKSSGTHGNNGNPETYPPAEHPMNNCYKTKTKPRFEADDDVGFGHGCASCPKRFRTRRQLFVHQRVHSDQRPYSCDICQQSFKAKSSLKLHADLHSNIKAYECETCGKRFNCKGVLVQHEIVHMEDKPYKCPTCDKRFRNKYYMKRHRRLHTDDETGDRVLYITSKHTIFTGTLFNRWTATPVFC